jgi:hypothetical protein
MNDSSEKKEKSVWDKITAIAAILSLGVSGGALWISISGTQSSITISSEALQTARQANDIALGRLREPSIIEYSEGELSDRFDFDFTVPGALSQPLQQYFTVRNSGKTNIDGISIEAIGIEPFTYPLSNPGQPVRPLPYINIDFKFRTALQPDGFAHIDIRKIVLEYLTKLAPLLTIKDGVYTTSINIVLTPKATTETTPIGASSALSKNDRRLIEVKFTPDLLNSQEARAIVKDSEIQNRVFIP